MYPGALAAVFDLLESEKASSKVIIVHLMRLLLITVLVSFLIPGQAAAVAVAEGDPLTTGMALTDSHIGLYAYRAGFLAVGKVHLAGNRPLGHVEDRGLAFHVDALDGLFQIAADEHLLEHPQALRVARCGHVIGSVGGIRGRAG